METRYFPTPADFRRWLEENHEQVQELHVGIYKKATGRKSISYPEALDEALCFGWIDGVRRRVDEESYTVRFTPRKPGSNWSRVNIEKVEALIEEGRMAAPGLAAFAKRDESVAVRYSYEQRHRGLGPEYEERFRAHEAAWAFFQAQPPYYRKTASWWVMSAKREETRLRRLAVLIEDSAAGRRLAAVTYRPKS